MRIQAICDGEESSASTWMAGIARYSKHEIEIRQWSPSSKPKPDLVYFHYGSLANGNIKFIEENPDIPCGIGVLGMHDFVCIIGWGNGPPPHILKMKGAIILGTQYYKMFTDKVRGVPAHICDVGVETNSFLRFPPPKHFVIGYAENNNDMFTDPHLQRLMRYGFPVVTAGAGKGTFQPFSKMPKFYEIISVFIDNVFEPRPGGLMFLEAGSVGRPSICMKSGIMADWFPKEYLAEDDADVVRKLTRLRDDSEYYAKSSNLWRGVAESRDYSVIYRDYDKAWEAMVNAG